jgi:hypothetical protein
MPVRHGKTAGRPRIAEAGLANVAIRHLSELVAQLAPRRPPRARGLREVAP